MILLLRCWQPSPWGRRQGESIFWSGGPYPSRWGQAPGPMPLWTRLTHLPRTWDVHCRGRIAPMPSSHTGHSLSHRRTGSKPNNQSRIQAFKHSRNLLYKVISNCNWYGRRVQNHWSQPYKNQDKALASHKPEMTMISETPLLLISLALSMKLGICFWLSTETQRPAVSVLTYDDAPTEYYLSIIILLPVKLYNMNYYTTSVDYLIDRGMQCWLANYKFEHWREEPHDPCKSSSCESKRAVNRQPHTWLTWGNRPSVAAFERLANNTSKSSSTT